MAKTSIVVVGAGLAGLSAAYSLAKNGIDTLVVERGDYPGAKTVTGGRLYFNPIKDIFPELWAEAPFERHVVREVVTLAADRSSLSLDFRSQDYSNTPHHSYTVLSSRFNKWLAQQATKKGARVIGKYKVDSLIMDGSAVKGVTVGGARIESDVVIAADGVMSRVAGMAGLRGGYQPKNYALGVKEIIALNAEEIEKRFGVLPGEGVARLFVGSLSRGMLGGGFLYTNQDSVSLGMVLGIHHLTHQQPLVAPYEILDEFKQRPEVAPLIQGGESVEYSAHVISEGGPRSMPRLYGDGILVAGDAAGMVLNLGLIVRGMDYAIASGALAAQAAARACKAKDFSAQSLSAYERLLKESFVLKDFHTFRDAPAVLDNPRFYTEYPELACETFTRLFEVGAGPRPRLSSAVIRQLRGHAGTLLKDAWRSRRI